MVNKLWYENLDQRYDAWIRKYLQELIDLYCPSLFTVPEDITPDNFQQFLEIILEQCKFYNIHKGHQADLSDAFDIYFHHAYQDEFPDTCYPDYPANDRRNLALTIFNNCFQGAGSWIILPEEVPFLIECLNAPDEEIVHIEAKIEKYFKQFDLMKRNNIEMSLRGEILKKQRLEALEKGKPLPIRPMGLKLDLCYKNDPNPHRGKLWDYIYLNYSAMLSEKAPDIYEGFLFGREAEAEAIMEKYQEILINRCRKCGNIKSGSRNIMCSNCWTSSQPLLGRK